MLYPSLAALAAMPPRPLRNNACCGRKCPCVVIEVGTVETLKPGQKGYVCIEKMPDSCDYVLNFGLPVAGKPPKGEGLQSALQGLPQAAAVEEGA